MKRSPWTLFVCNALCCFLFGFFGYQLGYEHGIKEGEVRTIQKISHEAALFIQTHPNAHSFKFVPVSGQ